jgi:hypothetical protein
MNKETLKAAFETIKLPLRIFVLALIPFLIAYLTKTGYEWAGIVTAFLTLLDKFLHELWRIEEDKDLKRENEKPIGIIPF